MTITHHLDDATLMSFAAGALPAALAAVAAAHADMCPRCRREMAALERVGAALMSDLPGADVRVPPPAADLRKAATPAGSDVMEIPRPVARLIGGGLNSLRWRWLGPGVWHHELPIQGTGKLRLLRVGPERSIPEHGHGGSELTLVLRGAFHDETGHYGRGDVADLDEEITHQPITDPGGDCICLVASDSPEQFRGVVARRWQRLRGF